MNESRLRPPGIRQSVTVYIRWQDPASGTNGATKSFRRVLTNCFLSEEINSIVRQTGIVQNQSFFVQIFKQPDLEYVPLHVWKNIGNPEKDPNYFNFDPDATIEERLAGYWSIDPLSPSSIIVDHVSDVVFGWLTWSNTTAAENAAFITPATAEPGARRIASIENNMRGSPRAQHILLRA